MTDHVITAESAMRLLDALSSRGVDPCVGGGWAVDALLRRQTREHSDLDLWVAAPEAEPAFIALAHVGVDRIFPWPGDRPWNFVVHDGQQLRVDLHFYEHVDGDTVHYGAFDSNEFFPVAALTGQGMIGTARVRCEQPEWTLRWHSGYPLRAVDHHDVPLLCEKFALELPAELRTGVDEGGA